eukprot:3147-Rhodomonas_salina.1
MMNTQFRQVASIRTGDTKEPRSPAAALQGTSDPAPAHLSRACPTRRTGSSVHRKPHPSRGRYLQQIERFGDDPDRPVLQEDRASTLGIVQVKLKVVEEVDHRYQHVQHQSRLFRLHRHFDLASHQPWSPPYSRQRFESLVDYMFRREREQEHARETHGSRHSSQSCFMPLHFFPASPSRI